MSTSLDISFPLDEDGFLSQQCPTCMKVFKVDLAQEPTGKQLSYCPYCGHHGQECWWTTEQVEYINGAVQNQALNPIIRDFQKNLQGLNNPGGGFTVTTTPIRDDVVVPPSEPGADMPKHLFRCCDETIKHLAGTQELHCVICGTTDRGGA